MRRRVDPTLFFAVLIVPSGYVEDIVIDAVLEHPDLDLATKRAVLKALNKILWIQNDRAYRHPHAPQLALISSVCAVFAKHYVKDLDEIEAGRTQDALPKYSFTQFPVSIVLSLALTGFAYKFFVA